MNRKELEAIAKEYGYEADDGDYYYSAVTAKKAYIAGFLTGRDAIVTILSQGFIKEQVLEQIKALGEE